MEYITVSRSGPSRGALCIRSLVILVALVVIRLESAADLRWSLRFGGRIWRRYKTALGAPGRVFVGRAYDH